MKVNDGVQNWDETSWTYTMGATPVYGWQASHDALGRPVSTADSESAARSWTYNERSEMTGCTSSDGSYSYFYDSIGNRTSSSSTSSNLVSVTHSYTANGLNQYAYVDSTAFIYDADGNLVNDGQYSYAYDCENRLVSVTPTSPQFGDFAMENAYDHRSRRVQKTVWIYDGEDWLFDRQHTFVWDGWNIVLERIDYADFDVRFIEYYWGDDLSGSEQGAGGVGGLLAVSCDGTFYVPFYDCNGNIMGDVDEFGNVVARYAYDPFGKVVTSFGGTASPAAYHPSNLDFYFGFSTKYHDREVGLIAYQLRSYSPALGRWLNRDPIEEEGGVNLYGFLGNNQICITDVLGLLPYQYQTTVWGTYWYPQPRRPKSPDRQPRISNFGTFLESILDFLVCNSGTTYYYYYPQHSATVRLLKHPQVAKVWKLFKSIKNPGAYSRGKIHYKATKFDYCMDVITFFNTNPMALVMPMPKISLETISNIMAFDVGYQALGSFDGEYTIKTNFDMCTKTLDMKLWNTWSLVSLTRNPFSERRSSFLSQETFERESHFWSDIKQFYIYFVVEPITRVEMWAR